MDTLGYKCVRIFILHFEPRLMSVLYGIPTIRPLEFQMGKPFGVLHELFPIDIREDA